MSEETPMIAVIFEAWPAPGQCQRYFDIAAALKPRLEEIDGFISIERFQSLATPGKVLSLSFWRDERAITEWRRLESHRAAQAEGHASVFADYRLRIAGVVRDYGFEERDQAPLDRRDAHG